VTLNQRQKQIHRFPGIEFRVFSCAFVDRSCSLAN
jgi:hypothetical protein